MKTKTYHHWLQLTAALILIAALAASASITRAQSTISVGPETIPDGSFGAAYSQQFTASGGTEPYTFTLTGSLPSGLIFSGDTLSGMPTQTGSFPITIQAQDANSDTGSRDYNLVIAKATPTVTISADPEPSTYTGSYWLMATIAGPAGVTQPRGGVDFYVDSVAIPNCTQQPTETGGIAYCPFFYIPTILAIGDHTVHANYSPDNSSMDYYTTGQGEGTHTVVGRRFAIGGKIFNDLNENGVWDSNTEPYLTDGWTVTLDEGCDGTVDQSTVSDSSYGNYTFSNLLEGLCYRLSEVVKDGWRQTTTLSDITLSGTTYEINIGNVELQQPVTADLRMDVTDKSDPVKPGARLLYTLTVTNFGLDPATNVQVGDYLDPNTTLVSVSAPRGWSCFQPGPGLVVCTRDVMAVGTARIKLTVKVNKGLPNGTILTNHAEVMSETYDPDTSDNSWTEPTLVQGK